ncbi:hypothetical protein [Streptococcus iners]|uniref:Uncharacterized protein n=1 Tax=Streptococcus iners TaxID=3028084 RepID=A0AA97A416_9STRE|nr:hypothetical protein [Streptococcus sp. 29887]MCK4026707.1 hypothetical protein [Streptococcus suis]WNY51514.1 hypothetical protein PW252_02300 [Streptococcus sp. 29887]
MTVDDIITTCHKINTKPNIHLGEVQDMYESKDGQMRYYVNRENGVAYLYATQKRGEFISVVNESKRMN